MPNAPILDADTKKELSDGEEVANLVNSRGWNVIFDKLKARILDLQNINNLDLTKPETLSIQLAGRKMATDEIWAWLNNDVFGYVEQQRVNSESLIDKTVDGYIVQG